MLTVRVEGSADWPQTFKVHSQAFGGDDEAHLVEALRRSPAFIPDLSLVALDEEHGIVGHILFTRIVIADAERSHAALALAPVGVLPARQRQGVGSALVRRGLDEARRLGHRIVIVVGHPDYYPAFGFESAAKFGIRAPFDVPPEAFMAVALQPGTLDDVRGEVRYPAEFALV
jgi:putative acetyltransferase